MPVRSRLEGREPCCPLASCGCGSLTLIAAPPGPGPLSAAFLCLETSGVLAESLELVSV